MTLLPLISILLDVAPDPGPLDSRGVRIVLAIAGLGLVVGLAFLAFKVSRKKGRKRDR